MGREYPQECPECGGDVDEYGEIDTYGMFVDCRDFHLICIGHHDCKYFKKEVYRLSYQEPTLDCVVNLVQLDRIKAEKEAEARANKKCCDRDECEWLDGVGENDHSCPGFVKSAIVAQMEDLGEGTSRQELLKELLMEEMGLKAKN
tara:strand:+ start:1650 stop:2087 length:438 start_codon:yes stop_codon:yes gene_type:complete